MTTRVRSIDDLPSESNAPLSMLQLEILMKLKLSPGSTVTQIASAITSHRPAVSRAMQTLRAKGMAEQRHRVWYATERGLIEAEQGQEAFRQSTLALQDTAHKAFEGLSRLGTKQDFLLQMAKQFGGSPIYIGDAMQSVVADLSKTLHESSSFDVWQRVAQQMPDISKWAQASSSSALDAIGVLAKAQAANASLLPKMAEVMASQGFQSLLQQNTHTLAAAMENIAAFSRLTISVPAIELPILQLSAELSQYANGIAVAAGNLMQEGVVRMSQPLFAIPRPGDDILSLRVPGLVVRDFSSGARSFLEAELEPDYFSTGQSANERSIQADKIDVLLSRVNPEFVGIRRGAWYAIYSRSPDKVRQASTSMRDLIWQVLRTLAPGIVANDQAERGAKVKGQIKQLFGGSDTDAEFVDQVANGLASTLNALSKRTHTNDKHVEAMEALLGVADNLLYFVLVYVEHSSQPDQMELGFHKLVG